MAKNEFIGIRVSKEFKKFIQGEAKRRGMSLAEFIEQGDLNFRDTKKHIQKLIEKAKGDRPDFWAEADKSQMMVEFERIIPDIVSDILNPMGHDPNLHPVLVLNLIPMIMKAIVNLDSISDDNKFLAISKFLSAGVILAENLNKLKSRKTEEQAQIISDIKKIIEMFVFYFTSLAFAKDSFLKIKEELDKTESLLLKEIKGYKRR